MVTYVKISELPPATEATGDSEIEVNQAGVTRKITVDQIADVVAEILPSPVAAISTTATPPASPTDGQMWWNSDAASGGGQLYIRYNDGDTTQWVPATPIGGASPGSGSLVVTPDQFGIFGNPKGTASPVDETAAIAAMIEAASDNGQTILWGDRLYAFDHAWLRKDDVFIRWRSEGTTILRSTKLVPDTVNGAITGWEADAFVEFNTNTSRQVALASTVTAGQTAIVLDATADLHENDTLLDFRSTRMIETDNLGQTEHGWWVPIHRIVSGTTVEIARPVPVTCEVGDIAGVTVVSSTATTVVVAGLAARSRNEVMYHLRFTTVGGVASALMAYPQRFDVPTQTYHFNANSLPPVGLIPGDTITVVRQVTVGVGNSIDFDIEGFTFERAPHAGAVADDLGFRGLRVYRGLAPRFVNVAMRHFSEAGIVVNACYAPHVERIRVEGCNRAWGGFEGTGYGVGCVQSSWGTFRDIQGVACRRVLDFGGSQGGSYHCVADNIQHYGGGTGYDGTAFWPAGATLQTATGSHGAAWYTQYINIRGFNVYAVLNLRGFDESAQGIYGAGRIEYMINTFAGDGFVVDGVHYTNGIVSWVTDPLRQHGYPAGNATTPANSYWLTSVVNLSGQNVIPTKPWMLSNLHIRGVNRAVIDVGGPGECGPIVISGAIDIMTADFTGADTSFMIVRPFGTGVRTMLGPVYIGQASILGIPTVGTTAIPKTLVETCDPNSTTWAWAPDAYIRAPNGTYMFILENNTVCRVPVNNQPTTGWVSVRPYTSAAPFVTLIDAQLTAASASNSAPVPNMSANVALSNAILSGTTGTVGNLTVAYRPSGGLEAVYVENRTGAKRAFVLQCDTGI